MFENHFIGARGGTRYSFVRSRAKASHSAKQRKLEAKTLASRPHGFKSIAQTKITTANGCLHFGARGGTRTLKP